MILPKDCLVVLFCFNGGLHPPKRFAREILNKEIMVQFLMHISKNRAKSETFVKINDNFIKQNARRYRFSGSIQL